MDNKILDNLIERISKSDKEALSEIYHLTSASVYGFALSILKNTHDAEDVLHDTYLSVYSSAAGYSSTGKPLAWIITITRNLCLMKIRNRKRIIPLIEEDWINTFSEMPGVTPEDRIVLAACMDKLNDEERQIVMLHAVSGFKHREISETLSMPLSTVLSKYRRALKKLRVLLKEDAS